jgi:hypothetical protein
MDQTVERGEREMTRQEAIKTMASSGWFGPDEVTEKWIDIYVALGMLKLEEPKTLQHRICDALSGVKVGQSGWVDDITVALMDHGLKIVEKQ